MAAVPQRSGKGADFLDRRELLDGLRPERQISVITLSRAMPWALA
ncbi:MAG: hypothetical protein U1E87_02425 [Alphaproteobacteria bacterium]